MRVGKKPNVLEIKKTRSCVVRLEKVSKNSPNVSPSPEENRHISRTNRLSATNMGATPKGRKALTSPQQEDKARLAVKKRTSGGSANISSSSFQTTQQKKGSNSSVSNVRSNQKIKEIPRSNKTTPTSTPSRDATPPPTIAAGRSRRAIKPNPKYASEDMVTPKVVRNVAMLSSSSRGSTYGQGKGRKASSSSDDFYNRNSEDDYESEINNMDNDNDDSDGDLHYDKPYQASEKDEHDSDFSVIEEPVRVPRQRGRSKKFQEPTHATTNQQISNKLISQPSNIKRASSTVSVNSSSIRSTNSQLQQIRRSLASANSQRNLNLLVGSSGAGQKRKLEEDQDLTDNESNYSIKRKHMLSNSSGNVKVPVRENRINIASTPIIKNRLSTQPHAHKIQHQQTVNGNNKFNNTQITSRRAIEITAKSNSEAVAKLQRQSTATTHTEASSKTQDQNSIAKMLASKALRFRSGPPKLPAHKQRHNNGATISISSSSSSSALNTNRKTTDKAKQYISQSTMKAKAAASSHNSSGFISEKANENKDDSPNSTMDDFETMPTFTIVNVNDIINKKGDVLITKAKSNSNKTPTVIELSESISLDDDDDIDNENDDVEEIEAVSSATVRAKQTLSKKLPKVPTIKKRREMESKKLPLNRSNETINQAPQILNHKLGLRNSRTNAKNATTLTTSLTPDKPAPRILNSMVAKKTQPVKPMIANMDDSADESFPLSLDEDEEENAEQDTEDEIEMRKKPLVHASSRSRKNDYKNLIDVDTEDTESQNTEEDDTNLHATIGAPNRSASKITALSPKQNLAPQRRRRAVGSSNTPVIVSSSKKRLTPAAAKENSLAAINQQAKDVSPTAPKQPIASMLPPRKLNTEKVVISKQGDKIIKKITCFETWYVINMPVEPKRPTIMKNQLEMPLIHLANLAKNICLPNDMWSSKVTLYELSPQTLAKGTFVTYTGDIYEHNISEEDRGKYQPSCVMFRRSIERTQVSRMPYDRAVIFKNKTFYTNIEGKNVRLVGAPSIINSENEIEILLEVVDNLTLQSEFVEHISIVQ